jgi:hypothetical protein
MRSTTTQLDPDAWKHGYPADYVTANAICATDEFNPDANPNVRVGFRPGYFPDPTYRDGWAEHLVNALEEWWTDIARALTGEPLASERVPSPRLRQAALPMGTAALPSVSYDGPVSTERLLRS